MRDATGKNTAPASGPGRVFLRKSPGFRTRFLAGAAVALLIICFVGSYLIYDREKQRLEQHAYTKTQLVMAAVESSRQYVREELRPRMYDEFGGDFFMLHAMSTSYVGRAVMDNFNEVLPEYDYRRVAKNARNPDSEANNLEMSMINHFREKPDTDNWQGMLDVGGQKQFMRFKPVYFRQSCMSCHGDPSDAPADLVSRYGTENGFDKQPGDLAGVVAVGIPVDHAMAEIMDRAASVFFVMFAGALVFYAALALIFNRLVVNNLRGVLHVFREDVEEKQLQDFMPESDPERPADELQELTEAAITMSEHLRSTRQELRQYARNLEQKVEKRTRELEESKRLLQHKVVARNRELSTLNRISELTTQAEGLNEVWHRVVNQCLELIPAAGAGVYLYCEDGEMLELQHRQNAPGLPDSVSLRERFSSGSQPENLDIADSLCRALSGNMSSIEDQDNLFCLNIPMSCRGSVLGVLSFSGLENQPGGVEQQELLMSVGRQAGIAVESLRDVQRLVHSKELLQTVFDGITDQLMLLDRDYRIRMVNRAYLNRYGVEYEDVEGSPCYEVHPGLEQVCPDCALSRVMDQASAHSEEIKCPTGELFLVHFYPVIDENGEVESVIRYAREISEQKKVEQKIQQAEKLVAMGELASGIAHEINNPLGVILCYVDLLKRQLADFPQGLNDLGVIERQAVNCRDIVTDLLQFSRGRDSEKAPAQLNEIIREVARMFKHKLEKNKIHLELELDSGLPEISVDADKIKQVLVNLLINSLHAVSKNGKIHISSGHQKKEERIWISIWDSGQGVDESIRSRIFDPFFSTKQTGKGTGLGLSVSYGIARNHGGEITVQSEKGAWTRFNIFLPTIRRSDKNDNV
ncbi:MAG: c-type heme family protein [Desulfosalsimonas sp.]